MNLSFESNLSFDSVTQPVWAAFPKSIGSITSETTGDIGFYDHFWLTKLLGNAAINYLFPNQIDMVLDFTVAAVLELLAHWRGRFLMNIREILVCSSLKAII